jgi:hypothetical protein
MKSPHPWLGLALDVAVSLVIANVAALFADCAMHFLTPNAKWMYGFWFAVGMLPLAFYARYRGVVQFDCWDLLYWSPFPIVMGLIEMIAGRGQIAVVVIGVLLSAYASLQARIVPRYTDMSESEKPPDSNLQEL